MADFAFILNDGRKIIDREKSHFYMNDEFRFKFEHAVNYIMLGKDLFITEFYRDANSIVAYFPNRSILGVVKTSYID